MGIFRCRPLALGAVILAACIAIALQLSRIATLWVTVVAAISFLVVLILVIRTKKDALCYLAALLLIFVLFCWQAFLCFALEMNPFRRHLPPVTAV